MYLWLFFTCFIYIYILQTFEEFVQFKILLLSTIHALFFYGHGVCNDKLDTKQYLLEGV